MWQLILCARVHFMLCFIKYSTLFHYFLYFVVLNISFYFLFNFRSSLDFVYRNSLSNLFRHDFFHILFLFCHRIFLFFSRIQLIEAKLYSTDGKIYTFYIFFSFFKHMSTWYNKENRAQSLMKITFESTNFCLDVFSVFLWLNKFAREYDR